MGPKPDVIPGITLPNRYRRIGGFLNRWIEYRIYGTPGTDTQVLHLFLTLMALNTYLGK